MSMETDKARREKGDGNRGAATFAAEQSHNSKWFTSTADREWKKHRDIPGRETGNKYSG
jgi:hypothetical protein